MARPDVEDRIREIAALSKQQHQVLATAATPQYPAGSTAAMTFAVGSRVLDLVTGETGVVLDGYRRNEVISTAKNQGS